MLRALALHVAASALLLHCAAFAQSPQQFQGLHESATISIDAEGIAHVRANNEHDLYFLQGWTHARERLFQMDYFRRVASGSVAGGVEMVDWIWPATTSAIAGPTLL